MGDDGCRWTSRFFLPGWKKRGKWSIKPQNIRCIILVRGLAYSNETRKPTKLVPAERVLVNEAHVFMYFNSWERKATLLGVINKIWSRRTCGKQQQPRWRRQSTTTTTTPIIFLSMTLRLPFLLEIHKNRSMFMTCYNLNEDVCLEKPKTSEPLNLDAEDQPLSHESLLRHVSTENSRYHCAATA